MTEHHDVPGASELVYTPRPSWAPVFFAAGSALAICGIFSAFLVPSWVYSVIGIVVGLAALRSLVSGTVHGFFRLPQRQKVRGAVLPASSLHSASRERGSD